MLSVDDEWASFLSQSQPTFSVSFSNTSSFNGKPSHDHLRTPTQSVANASLTPRSCFAVGVLEKKAKHTHLPLKNIVSKIQSKPNVITFDGKPSKDNVRTPDSETERVGVVEEDELQYPIEYDEIEEIDAPAIISNPSNTTRQYVTNELFISTKTKVLFLNQAIDINDVFWKIPVEEYWKPVDCVVKKQMKIVSKSPEEYEQFMEKLKSVPYYTENIIKQINNPTARRIKFKDERKITVGISKKDIMNCRGKVKNAFYNCFAIIIRFKYEGEFREIHVKIFNTGKLEIPGVLNAEILEMMRQYVLKVLQPHISTPLAFIENSHDDNVLINSNFNCGFYIDREKLFSILRSNKYGLETAYDPCIYPGIKCKFYFNNTAGLDDSQQTGRINTEDRNMKMSELGNNKTYTEVSFMIFRTGSCLIVGNCSETILEFIFQFIKNILIAERPVVAVANEDSAPKIKHPKLRKKSVNVSANYLSALAK